MKYYAQELEYMVIALNDYLNTLPQSAKIAVSDRMQLAIARVEEGLREASEMSKPRQAPDMPGDGHPFDPEV